MAIQHESGFKPALAITPTSTDKGALTMVTTLFFMWGFLTCLNDILIPHLKTIFELSYAQVMLVQFAFFSTYFVLGVPAGKLVERIGYKPTMVTGLLVMALGALGFIPAAMAPSFPLFLGALIVLAAGITALQVSANPYVSILGPPRTASSRLNLTQAFNSLGTTIAPVFGGMLILAAAPKTSAEMNALGASALQLYRQEQASSVKTPYILIAAVLILLAVVIAFYKLPKIGTSFDAVKTDDRNTAQAVNMWRYRHLIFGVIGIFVYVGAEVAIGSFLVELLQSAVYRQPFGERRGQVGFVVLGRCNGGPLHRRPGAAETARGNGSWIGGDCSLPAGCHFDALPGPGRHVEHHPCRVLQLDHVPQHLHARHCRPGTVHWQRFGFPDCRDRGRRDHSGDRGRAGRQDRHPLRLYRSRDLLPVHHVLRIPRFARSWNSRDDFRRLID